MDRVTQSKSNDSTSVSPGKSFFQQRRISHEPVAPAQEPAVEQQPEPDQIARLGIDMGRIMANTAALRATASASAPSPAPAVSLSSQPLPDVQQQAEPERGQESEFARQLFRNWATPPASQIARSTSPSDQPPAQEPPHRTGFDLTQHALHWPAPKSEARSTSPTIQFKLTIGQPGDRYEQEADQVAAQVMAMPEPANPSIQRQELTDSQESEEEAEEIQAKPLADSITPLVQRQTEEESEEVQTKESEAESEAVQAKSLVSSITPLQRQTEDESEEVQAKSGQPPVQAENPAIETSLENQLASSKGSGSPLGDDVRSFMESRFNTDFSHVRVHTDSSAIQMNKDLRAQAFTHGSSIYFGAGKSPGQNDLTAHELTHVVQQTGAKTLQRKSTAALKPHKEGLQTKISSAAEGATIQRKQAPRSPQADPGFQSVVKRTKEVAKQQKTHPPATAKANEAQAAAVSPPSEKESKAQDRQVQEMNQQKPGQFDAAKFKAALMQKISAAAPSTLEEADKCKDGKQLEGVKRDASSQVGNEKKQAAAAIEDKTKEPPKTGGIPDKPVTPLPPQPPATPPGDIGTAQAVPKPKDASEVSMAEGSKSLDQQMASANVTEQQIEKSNEPEFKGSLTAKKEAQADAATAPAEYRQKEQATIAQAQTQAQATAQAPLQGMQAQKGQALSQVTGKQEGTKGQDEQKRADIANHIQGIYNNTKQKVETLLSQLDGEVNQEFDRGANAAKQAFDGYVNQRMQRFKDERYPNNPAGWAQWVIDKVKGPPPEVNGFYAEGRKLYLQSMDGALDRIANLVSTKLNAAKTEIANGRQEIQKYVAGLDPSLRQIGQQAAQEIQSKFDALEQNVDNKQNELIDSLAQKYNEKLEALDAEIEKKKEENKGLVDKAKDAIGETIQTILKLKDMLMGMLAKAAGAIGKIIQDPIGFLGNLVAGLKQGFMGFMGNIANHLKKGLLGWLTGALAGAGIEMPKSFDLKGIFALVTSLLGLTYQAMRDRVANKVGEKKVSALEKGFDMFIIWKNEGAAGLWKFIQDKLTTLKDMVIGGIQSFVTESIISAGVTWILSLLNPASAFVRACKMIIDVIMFFVERGSQIADLVNAVLDSVSSIADGAIGVAAKLVEGALGKALPVVIGFLASLIGLGGISGKIRGLIEQARELIDKAIDWVMSKAITFVKKLGGKLGGSKLGQKFKAGVAKTKDLKDRGVKKFNELKEKGKKKLQDLKEKAAKKLGFIKGKNKKDNKAHEASKLKDTEVGKTINFNAKGESHRLWISTQGTSVSVIVASSPNSVETKLNDWQRKLDSLSEGKRARAQSLLNIARQQLGTTEQSAQKTAQKIQQAKQDSVNETAINEAEVADDQTEVAEQSLTNTLQQIFELFGENSEASSEVKEKVKIDLRARASGIKDASQLAQTIDALYSKYQSDGLEFLGVKQTSKEDEFRIVAKASPLTTLHLVKALMERTGTNTVFAFLQINDSDALAVSYNEGKGGNHAEQQLIARFPRILREYQSTHPNTPLSKIEITVKYSPCGARKDCEIPCSDLLPKLKASYQASYPEIQKWYIYYKELHGQGSDKMAASLEGIQRLENAGFIVIPYDQAIINARAGRE